MKEFSITELARIIKADRAGKPGSFTGVSIDSRTVKAGDCFFAIKGENFDGHDYVFDALAKGAVCAVVGKDLDSEKSAGKILLKVDNCIDALGNFARQYRKQAGFKVVAITGSVGKTTTRQIIYHVLSRHFRVFQAPKNFNNNIGLPLTLLGAEPEDEIVVAELGSNYPGEIAYLTRIAQPDIAVVTNVHPAHLAGFGNLQTIIQEKLSIFEGLSPEGTLLINADIDQLADACRAKGIQFQTFGKSNIADYQARNITSDGLSSRFTIEETEVHLPLPGPGNIDNALAAWAVAGKFGISADDFAQAAKTLSATPMRAELLKIGTLTVLNDCYNANPASMRNALDILADMSRADDSNDNRRTVFICGDMAELAEQSERLHRELGRYIAQSRVQLLLAVGKFAKIAAEAAKRNARGDLQIKCFEDTLSACNKLQNFIKKYDIILVKGSRTAKLELVVEKLKRIADLRLQSSDCE